LLYSRSSAIWSFIPLSRAEEDRWWGEITATTDEGTYTVQIEDGRLFKVDWYAGYSGWAVGDTVILTVESGFGFMVYGTNHTRVWVDEVTDLVPDDYRTAMTFKGNWRPVIRLCWPNLIEDRRT
jgi:hypothetical protein